MIHKYLNPILFFFFTFTAYGAGFVLPGGGLKLDNTNTVTAGSSVSLTSLSNQVQRFTGTASQAVLLPNATTLKVGYFFDILNSMSSGTLTVRNFSNSDLVALSAGETRSMRLVDNSSTGGTWVAMGAGGSTSFGSAPADTVFAGPEGVSGSPAFRQVKNADVASGASIAYSKLNLATSVINGDISPAASIAYTKLNLNNSINNGDIADGAGIAYAKLLLSGSIVNNDISASASIGYAKLNLVGNIVNADISSAASIGYSKLNLVNSIVNNDISSAASVGYGKLNLVNSVVNNDISASASVGRHKMATGTANAVMVNSPQGTMTDAGSLLTFLGNKLGINTASPGVQLDVNGSVAFRASTDSSSGTLNALSSLNTSFIRLTGTAPVVVNGVANGADGKRLHLQNLTGATVYITDNNASAAAADRIRTGVGASVGVLTNATATMHYDNTNLLWYLESSGSTGIGGGGGGGSAANYFQAVDTGNYRVVGANVASPSGGACAITNEIGGDWINGSCTSPGTGQCSCTINGSVFSSTPACVVVGNDPYRECMQSSVATSTLVKPRCFNPSTLSDLDSTSVVICFGPR